MSRKTTAASDWAFYLHVEDARKKGSKSLSVKFLLMMHPQLYPRNMGYDGALSAYSRGRRLHTSGWRPAPATTSNKPERTKRSVGRPRTRTPDGLAEDYLRDWLIYEEVRHQLEEMCMSSVRRAADLVHELLPYKRHLSWMKGNGGKPLSASAIRDAYRRVDKQFRNKKS